jgi:hypothetical protein
VERSGYRWIDSAYGNRKSLKISRFLDPGSYALIIIPEWKEKVYDLSLTYIGTTHTNIQKISNKLYKGIL